MQKVDVTDEDGKDRVSWRQMRHCCDLYKEQPKKEEEERKKDFLWKNKTKDNWVSKLFVSLDFCYKCTASVLILVSIMNTFIIPNSMIILRSIPWSLNWKSNTESPVQIMIDLLDPVTQTCFYKRVFKHYISTWAGKKKLTYLNWEKCM